MFYSKLRKLKAWSVEMTVSAEGIARYPVVVREAQSRGMLPLLCIVVA
jgi:hypothetical protein